jgi:hypothetical protein
MKQRQTVKILHARKWLEGKGRTYAESTPTRQVINDHMTKLELHALCNLLMCSDPSPVSDEQDEVLQGLANREAQKLGFSDWIDAFHRISFGG